MESLYSFHIIIIIILFLLYTHSPYTIHTHTIIIYFHNNLYMIHTWTHTWESYLYFLFLEKTTHTHKNFNVTSMIHWSWMKQKNYLKIHHTAIFARWTKWQQRQQNELQNYRITWGSSEFAKEFSFFRCKWWENIFFCYNILSLVKN